MSVGRSIDWSVKEKSVCVKKLRKKSTSTSIMAPKSKTKKGIAIEIEDSTLINEIEEKCNLSKPEIKEMMLRIADIVLKEMPKKKPITKTRKTKKQQQKEEEEEEEEEQKLEEDNDNDNDNDSVPCVPLMLSLTESVVKPTKKKNNTKKNNNKCSSLTATETLTLADADNDTETDELSV